MIANTLPLITWRWLKVNDSIIELPEVKDQVHNIVAEEGDNISTLFDINELSSENKARHTKINIEAKKGSNVDLYYVARCTDEEKALTDIVADVAEDACVNFIQVEAGAHQAITNYTANLNGKKSQTNVESVYFVNKDKKLDINYIINHIGEETNSNLLINGALKDQARKAFRGTIDFKRGSKLSNGAEEEYATLLDEGVRNIAVPVLLCQEDDVEGLHAASAGKIDQDILFYIMSRGLDIDSAKKMIVETKLAPTIHKLPNKELSESVWKHIEERI